MHGIIHHMHSGSGDAPDEHGGETHRLFRSLFQLVLRVAGSPVLFVGV